MDDSKIHIGHTSLKNTGQHSKTLGILVLGTISTDLARFFAHNGVLSNYLADINSTVTIQIFSVDKSSKLQDSRAIEVTADVSDYSHVRTFGIANDVDLVLDLQGHLVCDETKAYNVEFGYIGTISELYTECEAFLAGNGIPWDMRNPHWNDAWMRIFFTRAGPSKIAMDFLNKSVSNGQYSSAQVQRTRHLANRISQIEYSRLMLKYCLQMKRKERRRTQSQHTISFEVNYHLGNYYFLIAGAFDMLARLLNSVLGLDITQYKYLALEKPVFQEALAKRNKELAAIFTNTQNVDWLIWLKARRNYIGHEASIAITSIVKEPTANITDEELSKLVDEKLDWKLLSSILPAHLLDSQRRMVAELVKIDLYDVEIEDAMLLTDGKSNKIFLPLNSIDFDFQHMADMIEPTIRILSKVQLSSS